MERLGDWLRLNPGVVLNLVPINEGGDMSQAQPAEQEFVAGTIIGVAPHATGNKWTCDIMPDGSHFKKTLWVREPETAEDLAQRIGQRLTFMCGPSHYTGRQGQPVTSLWINGYSDVAAAPAASPQPSYPQTAQP